MTGMGSTVRLGRRVLAQVDQTVNVSWVVPAGLAALAFVITFAAVEWALPLLILATALDRYRLDVLGAGLRIEHFVFTGVAAAWLLRVRPRRAQWNFTWADGLLVVYLAVALLASALYAPALKESLKFLALMGFGVALYWFVRAMAVPLSHLVRGVETLIVVGVAASLFGIVAWLLYPLGINLGVQTYALENFVTFSAYGTLFDSNTLGMYAMAAALLQAALLIQARGRQRAALAAGLVITLAAVALSLTRTAWIGLGVGLALILLTSPQRKWALVIGAGAAALVVIALAASSSLAGGGGALGQFSAARVLTSRSIFFRLDAYARAWNDFLANPLLGSGVNVFAQKYTSPAGTRDWISNFFLMTLHDTGVVGMVILGGWLVWLGVEVWRALRRQTGTARTLLLALSIAYVALLVTYQATTVFWLGWNWVYLGLLRASTLVGEPASAPAAK